jgi:hypothetical protein
VRTEFLSILPKIQDTVWSHLRRVPCLDRRRDLLCEAVALGWVWHLSLARKGRSPTEFVVTFARLAARAVLSGRRLCGVERARDVLSPVCQRHRGFTVSPLPAGTAMVGNVFDEALVHNTQTPVPDQVQFRIDFPRWRASLDGRRRSLVDAMAGGERTTDLADTFGVTLARISQVRRELYDGWAAFCGDDCV